MSQELFTIKTDKLRDVKFFRISDQFKKMNW